MPLTQGDRRFLELIDRFKIYLLLLAISVLIYLLLTPQQEIQLATSIMGVALCAVFWLTQRLLSYITILDIELSRVANALKYVLPKEQREQLLPSSKGKSTL